MASAALLGASSSSVSKLYISVKLLVNIFVMTSIRACPRRARETSRAWRAWRTAWSLWSRHSACEAVQLDGRIQRPKLLFQPVDSPLKPPHSWLCPERRHPSEFLAATFPRKFPFLSSCSLPKIVASKLFFRFQAPARELVLLKHTSLSAAARITAHSVGAHLLATSVFLLALVLVFTGGTDPQAQASLVKVEPGKAGADNASKVGAALLLAETILRTAGIFSVWDTPTYDQGVAGAARISVTVDPVVVTPATSSCTNQVGARASYNLLSRGSKKVCWVS